MLRSIGNLELVRKALGHASVSTTQIYTHLVSDDLREVMRPEVVDEEHVAVMTVEMLAAEVERLKMIITSNTQHPSREPEDDPGTSSRCTSQPSLHGVLHHRYERCAN